MKIQSHLCPSCKHVITLHEGIDDYVLCYQQVDDGGGYAVDCWRCELTPEELGALID
jgi:hypothetical protein